MPILWLRRSRYGESGFILKAAFAQPAASFVWPVLSKETAVITPLAFALWELLQPRLNAGPSRIQRSVIALVRYFPCWAG